MLAHVWPAPTSDNSTFFFECPQAPLRRVIEGSIFQLFLWGDCDYYEYNHLTKIETNNDKLALLSYY